jgi:8-oxo-dGTP diphosphatase
LFQPAIKREYPLSPLVGVGALIIIEDKILLIRRLNPPSQGEWSIPGGLVRLGETLQQALMREALEETGLSVEPGPLVELLERILVDNVGGVKFHYVLADYLCRVVNGNMSAGSDASDAVWASLDELDRYSLASVTHRVIVKAFEWRQE